MLNKIKKGFTIVELVIVIAVIAILAGVLIPTFSSITKNAKQSAAMQQARNAMEATLALTGGAYPTGTDFVVDDGKDGKIDYWFSYEGNTLKDVTKTDDAKTEAYGDGFYAAYFSTKCFNEDVTAKDSTATTLGDTTLFLRSEKLLIEALGYGNTAGSGALSFDSKASGYLTYTFTPSTVDDTHPIKTVRIYYTTDIEPTLVIVLGKNN